MNRRNHSLTILQATQESPTFAKLSGLALESLARLNAIKPLIPVNLQGYIQAGPIEGTSWCLLLENNATAGKIKQIIPSLEAHLRSKGWDVNSIRLKVLSPKNLAVF